MAPRTTTLETLARAGHAEASFRLGYRLAFGRGGPRPRPWRRILRLWEAAGARGHERAWFFLGLAYETGRGVGRDPDQAIRCYEKGAKLGHPEAQYNLAQALRERGRPRDLAASLHWLSLGAEYDDPDCLRELGFAAYAGNLGLPKDDRFAARMYGLAAAQGDLVAQHNLALCYLEGEGVRKNRGRALTLLRAAAAAGYRPSRQKLAELGD